MCRKLTTSDFIKKSKEIHGNEYDYSLVNYINNKTKVKIICHIHGIFEQQPRHHLDGNKCKKCSFENRKSSTNNFIKKSNEIHGNKYDYSLVKYIDAKSKVKIKCPIHGVFEQTPNNHLSKKQGCPICVGKYQTTKKFIKQAHIIHDDKYDYSLVEYKNNYTKVKIKCPIHGVFEQRPYHHLNGCGCPKCSGCEKKTIDKFIIEANNIHNDKYDYTLSKYKSSHIKIKIICPIHGIFEQTPSSHTNGKHGCPMCNDSKGEKEIRIYLEKLNIHYISQKKFKKCKNIRQLPFDFYLPKYNICIEFDGEQHFKKFRFEKNDIKLLERQKRDQIKNIFCRNNNIILIRIRYDENIINILNKNITKKG